MRKVCLLILCLCLAVPVCAAAEKPRYIALTFEECPGDLCSRALLAGLAVREAKATFFLSAEHLGQYPGLAEQLRQGDHELGIQGAFGQELRAMSRRDIGGAIADTRSLLPEKSPVRLLRPPESGSTASLDQVAEAMNLAVIDWSLDPRDSAVMGRTVLERVRDGDVIRIRGLKTASVNGVLNLVDLLTDQGFTFVTVSELARLRGVRLDPGEHYSSFPPKE